MLRILPARTRHFNPRSREGSDDKRARYRAIALISIHAPAKGATALHFVLRHMIHISIHAPAKGATLRDRAEYGR